jgi:hypothetical protein
VTGRRTVCRAHAKLDVLFSADESSAEEVAFGIAFWKALRCELP